MSLNPATQEAEIRRTVVRGQPRQIVREPLSRENTSQKVAGGVAQGVEHLPSKCEALSANPCTTKKKKKHTEQGNNKTEFLYKNR
jgi:hypothetical protein